MLQEVFPEPFWRRSVNKCVVRTIWGSLEVAKVQGVECFGEMIAFACQAQCTVATIANGVESWSPAACVSGSKVDSGITCAITAANGYTCTDPGTCTDGSWAATAECKASCATYVHWDTLHTNPVSTTYCYFQCVSQTLLKES